MGKKFKKADVKMSDVAKAAGVSAMTVSRALKSDSSVSDETRKKVLKVIRDLNYVPDMMAGSLSSQKSGFIAALLPSLNNLHFAQTIQALTDKLEEVGLQILIGHTNYSAEKEEKIIETMLRRRPEVMVLFYDGHTERARQLLKTAAIPVIEIWETPEEPINHTVGFSNFEAAKSMTLELLDRGYKKIAFLGEAKDKGTRGAARRKGFISAMMESGFSADRLVSYKPPPVSIENGAEATKILLKEFPDTDCVFCVSDPAAFGAMSTIQNAGLKVPEDIAVVGFGNFSVSAFSTPRISTVAVQPKMIGLETAKLIIRILDNNKQKLDTKTNNHIIVGVHNEMRESS